MSSSTTSDTNVLPLLIVVYGIITIVILYGIVSLFRKYNVFSLLLFFKNTNETTTPKVRDTVNNNREITSIYDKLLVSYDKQMLELNNNLSISIDDINYILSKLRPTSTTWDLITICISCPTTLVWSTTDYIRMIVTRQQRIMNDQKKILEQEQQQKMKKKNATTTNDSSVDVFDEMFFQDDSGWDNDDDTNSNTNDDTDDETKKRIAAAKLAEEKRIKDLELLKKVSGTGNNNKQNNNILLEGIDEHVLGQQWVENALFKMNQWPPSSKHLGLFNKEEENQLYDHIDPMKLIAIEEELENTNTINKNKKTKQQLQKGMTSDSSISSITLAAATTKCKAIDHPAIRRTLCMVIARYNSISLNNDSELINAGMKQFIDPTYFKSSMEFRNRITMILEAMIQIAVTLQNYTLFVTILNTIVSFKLGVTLDDDENDKAIPWFNTLMMQQYNILPRLKVNATMIRKSSSKDETNKDENATTNEVTNDDDDDDDDDDDVDNDSSTTTTKTLYCGTNAEILLDVERIHAAQFLKVEVEKYQQQGIPPQVGLQTYRERWWFLLRMKQQQQHQKSSSNTTNSNEDQSSILKPIIIPSEMKLTYDPKIIQQFETVDSEDRLLTVWPLIIQNVAQQKGQVKISFITPTIPGKYSYYLHIHSMSFLGANQDLEFTINVLEKKKTSNKKTTTTTTTASSTITVDVEPKKDK